MRQIRYILIFIITLSVLGCTGTGQIRIPINLPFGKSGLVGQKPSFFQLPTLDGDMVSLADYEGKYLLLYTFHPY
jgi:hypothetical protein